VKPITAMTVEYAFVIVAVTILDQTRTTMPNYRPEVTDWNSWIRTWRDYWESCHREKPNGYYLTSDFPSEKLRAIDQIEKDVADQYDPRPSLIHYVEKTDRFYPSDGYNPVQRQMLRGRR
jgi:hypothetical protein